jgi:hypothetical protein
MSLPAYQAIEDTLMHLSAAAQSAHRGTREAAESGAEARLVEALEQAEREASRIWKQLSDASLGSVASAETQLKLEAA